MGTTGSESAPDPRDPESSENGLDNPDVPVPASREDTSTAGEIADTPLSRGSQTDTRGDLPQAVTPARRRVFQPRFRFIHIPIQVHTLDSFKYRDYRLVWASSFFSISGFMLQQVIIGWLTFHLTQSAFLTVVVLGLDALPILLVGPMGGVLVDLWDRRKLLALASSYHATISLAFGVLEILGRVDTWHIFGFVVMMGLGWVVVDPGRMSVISTVVPKQNLVNAFALNGMGFSMARFAAPAAGGVVLALAGPGEALLLEAAVHLTAVPLILLISLPPRDRAKTQVLSVFSEMLAGARYVRGEPAILLLLVIGIIPPLFVFPFVNALMPVYASEVYDTGSIGLGLLLSSVGAGSAIGTLVLASFGEIKFKGRLIVGGIAVTGVAMVAISQNPYFALAFPCLMVLSAAVTMFHATTGATIQGIVQDEFRGRVSSFYILAFGLWPVGSLISGSLAQGLGAPSATLIASGLVAAALAAALLRSRAVWRFT